MINTLQIILPCLCAPFKICLKIIMEFLPRHAKEHCLNRFEPEKEALPMGTSVCVPMVAKVPMGVH